MDTQAKVAKTIGDLGNEWLEKHNKVRNKKPKAEPLTGDGIDRRRKPEPETNKQLEKINSELADLADKRIQWMSKAMRAMTAMQKIDRRTKYLQKKSKSA